MNSVKRTSTSLSQLTESIGIVLNTIETNTRTEELLAQSQSLAGELKIQQEELRRTNDELQDKALLLVKQKNEVEAQEQGGGRSQKITGRKSRTAYAYFKIQIRVPCKYVA